MDLLLDLAAAPGSSLRRRAEHALREAVRSGRLPAGTRLPSTRALAAQLGVSRGVVVDAYAQLAAEGYLRTRRGGGTTVAEGAGATDRTGAGAGRPTVGRTRLGSGTDASDPRPDAPVRQPDASVRQPDGPVRHPAPVRHDLRPALPALDGFPRSTWLAAVTRVVRGVPDDRLAYADQAGVPELRAALAAYLGRVRGVRAEPEQVVVTSGMRHGLDLLWSTLVARGARRIAIEQPGWRGWRETAAMAGIEVVPLPVDRDGAVIDRLDAAAGAPAAQALDAVCVTPAHQFPTGAVLSAARRSALVAWAQRSGGLLVEDDYDAEFRYDRKPIGSLQGLAPEVVVYGGSVSKTLAPAIRLGWLVLPPALAEAVAARQRGSGGAPSPLDQLALADLIERGELDRHLRRQRNRYRRQRDALLAALAEELPEATVEGAAAGLHLVLRLPAGRELAAVLAAARARGVALDALPSDRPGPANAIVGFGSGRPGLVVGYGNIGEAAVRRAVAALAAAVRAATP